MRLWLAMGVVVIGIDGAGPAEDTPDGEAEGKYKVQSPSRACTVLSNAGEV
ncbi:hypothetical protein HDC37_000958 [Microbacterium sp. AK009]|uniref:hypothetical protein n=1 Tax=Microbacterium sp. AK009 TaxID=2723068 RepID=UPI0015CB4821|nr:hypothetical protein [Microbacterium sp. AK009]NYF16144.1 hypothetical protein [Microbacterium sp. AK009]